MWMGWVLLVTLPVFQAAVYSQDKAAGKPSADDHLSAYFASQTRLLSKSVGATTGTLAQWKIKQSELRGQLLDMLGLQPLPPKTDCRTLVSENHFVVDRKPEGLLGGVIQARCPGEPG